MKKLLAFVLSLAMVLSLAACGGADANVQLPAGSDASSTGSDAEYNISIATTGLPTQAPYMATTDFISAIEAAGNGRFKFVVHDPSSLGTDEDILKQVIDGILQVSAVGGTTFSMYTPLLEVLSLPFLLTDYEKEYAALTSDEYRAICDAVGEQLGIKILFTSENGIRHFATTKKPVTMPRATLSSTSCTMRPGSACWAIIRGSISSEVERNTAKSVPSVMTRPA